MVSLDHNELNNVPNWYQHTQAHYSVDILLSAVVISLHATD